MYLQHCVPVAQMFAAPQMETPSVVSPQVLSRLFLQQTLLFIDFFLFICVKIHTRSACSGMSVQKSFMISLNVGSVPQVLKLKSNLSIGEAPHEDTTCEE